MQCADKLNCLRHAIKDKQKKPPSLSSKTDGQTFTNLSHGGRRKLAQWTCQSSWPRKISGEVSTRRVVVCVATDVDANWDYSTLYRYRRTKRT
jgi:hypothetical protein